MSDRLRRSAARLALAILGVVLESNVVRAAPGEAPATSAASAGAGAALPPGIAAARDRSTVAAAAGKPVAPIAIRYELAKEPMLGVPFDVRISVRGAEGIADLVLTLHPGDGVQAGTPQLTASSADAAQRTWTVAATAYGEGTLYLGVLAQGTAGDRHAARNLLIPIRIGASTAAAPAAAPPPKTDSAERRVIVLPADVRSGN